MKYDENAKSVKDVIIMESNATNSGERIEAFSCDSKNIYAFIRDYKQDTADTYVNVYDNNCFFSGKLAFDKELNQYLETTAISQFQKLNNYIYIRTYSDYGIIAEIKGNRIEPLVIQKNLLFAYNAKREDEEHLVFYTHFKDDYIVLDTKNGDLYSGLFEILSLTQAYSHCDFLQPQISILVFSEFTMR